MTEKVISGILHYSLWKTVGKVSPILVTLTSRSDSDFEVRTSASKKINLMALIRTLTISTTTFEKMKEKFCEIRQTDYNNSNHFEGVKLICGPQFRMFSRPAKYQLVF